MKRIHIWFYGKIQGVFFRRNTREKALQLGINGWIKNLKDRSVEAVFEGEKIDKLLDYCKSNFDVSDIKVVSEEPENIKSFKIIYL